MKPTLEQQEFIDTWGEGVAVIAGAGSGKTTTLVAKCLALMKKNPGARFAAVSFTEKSASDIKKRMLESFRAAEIPLILGGSNWITTIHGLCGSIIREFPLEAEMDGEEKLLNETQAEALWKMVLDRLWFEELPEDVENSLAFLLERESRTDVIALLSRLKNFDGLGITFESTKGGALLEDPYEKALQVLGRSVLERYEILKRRRGAMDFQDLEKGAYRALQHEKVRKTYRSRFDLVLVDEFQDTNPVQGEILLQFARTDLSNLCIVGDPKQSIYRFRDADVTVFEDFCEKLGKRIVLNRNFRSRPGIIDCVNQVCDPLFTASQLRYDPLVAEREKNPDEEPVVRLPMSGPKELGEWILRESEAGVPLGDFALLMRKLRGKGEWLKKLSSSGVPLALSSGGFFYEDPRVHEMVHFLKWWDHPQNSLSGAIFLRAPWMGLEDATLDAWVKEDSTFLVPFLNSDHPLASVLKAKWNQAVRPGELLLELCFSDSVEDEIGMMALQLWHRCEELSGMGMDFHAVVSELSTWVEVKKRENDLPPPESSGQLRILTLHGSKGLEFPHVILVDFPNKKERAKNAPLLFANRKRGLYLCRRDADGDRLKEKDEVEADWREFEKSQELAESKRVFYVALTRAKERLIFAFEESNSDKEPKPVEKPLEVDYWRGWLESSGFQLNEPPRKKLIKARETVTVNQVREKNEIDASYFVRKRSRHSITEWNLLSRCSRNYEWTFVRARDVQKEVFQFDEESEAIPQREIGTRVHRYLEIGDFEGLDYLEREVGKDRFRAQPVVDWAGKSNLMNDFDQVWKEFSFEIPVSLKGSTEVLVGSMDRMIRKGDDFTIVDFKVTKSLKGAESLRAAYETQLWLYAYALGVLEPKAREGRMKAVLVNFSKDGVEEVWLELPQFSVIEERVLFLAEQSAKIVAGEVGEPKPGRGCFVCDFSKTCDVSKT